MDISLETFVKQDPSFSSETAGATSITVQESGYLELESLEEKLKASQERELLVPVRDKSVEVSVPGGVGALEDQKLRIFLDEQGEEGYFHLVARRASDDALVYTEPAMIRLVAV